MAKQKYIVLLHGWGANSAKLDRLATSLKKLEFSVFVPKLPGFGLKPPNEAWGVVNYANYVTKATDNHFRGKKYHVFGHSFGGRVAIKMARDNNQIIGAILCATGGISRANVVKRTIFTTIAKLGKIFLFIKPFAKVFRKYLYKLSREQDYIKTAGVMRETFKRVIAEDLKRDVSQIKKPLLVLWGKDDKMVKVNDAYVISKLNPKATLKLYENQGHRLPYELSDELANDINTWVNKFDL